MNNKFEHCIIYKIYCMDWNVTKCYVGSTCNLKRRKYSHRYSCLNEKTKGHNLPVYECIRENGGWREWEFEILEEVSCQNKKELREHEAVHIKNISKENRLNIEIPGRVYEEYHHEYYQDNKEIRSAYSYRYWRENKNKINARRTLQYECDCGNMTCRRDLKRHLQSKKHLEYIESLM